MTNKKISELPAATTIAGGDTLVIVQGGITKQATPDELPLGAAQAASVAATSATLWKPSTAYVTGQAVVNPSGFTVTALANFTSGSSYSAANWSDPTASTYSTLAQGKLGLPWWNSAFAAPPSDDTPTVAVATSGVVSGGTAVAPIPDYFNDPSFRHDGCADVAVDTAGTVKAVQALAAGTSYLLIPEFVTSSGCNQVDIKVTTTAAGTALGLRLVINGKWLTLPLQWFTTTVSTGYYISLTFPTAKARQIRVEAVNIINFGGVIVPAGETVTRPPREVRKRMVVLGDSYVAGANGNTTSDPTTNGCSRLETFPNYVAKLLGCDSIINLGVGGTGWVVAGSSAPFGSRVADILAASPHIVLAAGSRNDSTSTAAAVYAAVVAALGQLPDVPVLEVCGIMDDGSTSGTVQPAPLNAAVQQGARVAGRHFGDLLSVITPALKNTADSVHPSVIGAQFLAQTFYGLLDRPLIDETVAGAVGGRSSTDLTITASPAAAANSGATVTLTATLSTARAGKVSFYANNTLLGTATASGGSATYSTAGLAVGSYTFTARFQPTNPITVKPVTAPALTGYTVSANLGFTDSFNRADGVVTTTENGKTYTFGGTSSTTWAVSSNKLVNPSVASGSALCVADAGTPNGTYQVSVGGTTPAAAQLLLRYSDGSNYLKLTTSGGQIVLQQVVSNSSTTLFTGTGGLWVAGDVIKVVFSGDTVTVYKNTVAVGGLTGVTVSLYDTKTKFGVGISSSFTTALNYDDLSFVAG